jgi:hypothetical protein
MRRLDLTAEDMGDLLNGSSINAMVEGGEEILVAAPDGANTDWGTDAILRLSFTPSAIREHFEGDEPDPTEGMTDEQLREIGEAALNDDILYREFHRALVAAFETPEDTVTRKDS